MNILTVNLSLSTLVFWVAAKLYVLPKLQDYEARTILLPILLLHSLRHLGLMFLASGATYPGIPATVYPPGSLRGSYCSRASDDRHSSGCYSGAEREIVGVAF
jgi:hypothetical protein